MPYITLCHLCSFTGACNGACVHFKYTGLPRPDDPIPPSYEPKIILPPPMPIGCICPPESEKTCRREDCGRIDSAEREERTKNMYRRDNR